MSSVQVCMPMPDVHGKCKILVSSRVINHSFVGIITGYCHSNNELMIYVSLEKCWGGGIGGKYDVIVMHTVIYLEVGLINMQIL